MQIAVLFQSFLTQVVIMSGSCTPELLLELYNHDNITVFERYSPAGIWQEKVVIKSGAVIRCMGK